MKTELIYVCAPLLGVIVMVAIVMVAFDVIGHTPVPGEIYVIHNPSPFKENQTNTVLEVKHGFVLFKNQLGYTNDMSVMNFRFLHTNTK